MGEVGHPPRRSTVTVGRHEGLIHNLQKRVDSSAFRAALLGFAITPIGIATGRWKPNWIEAGSSTILTLFAEAPVAHVVYIGRGKKDAIYG